MMEEDASLGDEHTVQYSDNGIMELNTWNLYNLLTNITPINSIKMFKVFQNLNITRLKTCSVGSLFHLSSSLSPAPLWHPLSILKAVMFSIYFHMSNNMEHWRNFIVKSTNISIIEFFVLGDVFCKEEFSVLLPWWSKSKWTQAAPSVILTLTHPMF